MDKMRENYIMVRSLRGQTLQEIGDVFGITRERVRQILARNQITSSSRALNKKLRVEDRIEAKDAKSIKRHGCTWAQYVMLRNMMKPTRAFGKQRKNAKERGISWELTLWEWWLLWQKSGHWEERGRKAGQYNMCHNGDVGPYAKGNVYIATKGDNNRDAVRFREAAKLKGAA